MYRYNRTMYRYTRIIYTRTLRRPAPLPCIMYIYRNTRTPAYNASPAKLPFIMYIHRYTRIMYIRRIISVYICIYILYGDITNHENVFTCMYTPIPTTPHKTLRVPQLYMCVLLELFTIMGYTCANCYTHHTYDITHMIPSHVNCYCKCSSRTHLCCKCSSRTHLCNNSHGSDDIRHMTACANCYTYHIYVESQMSS